MSRRDAATALLLFALATAGTFLPVWRAGPATHVAAHETPAAFHGTTRADVIFQVWLVARHARTLLHRPQHLFDTEHCAPAQKTLTLGIPMVTQGVLAIPGALVFDDPVPVYNLTLALQSVLSAFAMYLLVASWTGVPAAGLVAGLLFGFLPVRLGNIGHPSVWDISWTVFALYFAERLSARGRWRDALGLGLSVAFQVGASFYPLLAACFLTPPFAAWLLWRDRLRALRPGPVVLVAVLALLAVMLVLAPYLGVRTEQGGLVRSQFYYLDPGAWASPSQLEFPGWSAIALVAVALCAGARRSAPGIGGDPRAPLLLGAALVHLFAIGPALGPNLHGLLAGLVPGFAAVRMIERLVSGVLLALILLAGLGAGVLVRSAGRWRPWVGLLLVAVAAFDVLRLPAVGLLPRHRWRIEEIRPDPDAIAFFERLEQQGNRGPVFELPIHPGDLLGSTSRILLTGYHGRRSSACFGSYRPPGLQALEALARQLPAQEALRELREQGFTTLVVHMAPNQLGSVRLAANLARAAEEGRLRSVLVEKRHAAFELLDAPHTGPPASR